MSSNTGGSETMHSNAIDLVIGDGADVRLMAESVDYGDGPTELDSKELSGTGYSSVNVSEADWSVSTDAATRTSTLTNDNEVDFGESDSDWGTVVEVVIDGGNGDYIVADEPNDPELTGEEYSFPAGEIEYTLGDSS